MRGLFVSGNSSTTRSRFRSSVIRQRQGLPHHDIPQIRSGPGRVAEPAGTLRFVLSVPVRALGQRRAVHCLHRQQRIRDFGGISFAVDAYNVSRCTKVDILQQILKTIVNFLHASSF